MYNIYILSVKNCMLSSYSFKVNTVKNNKILFVNASSQSCGLLGCWVLGVATESETQGRFLWAQWFGGKGSWNRGRGPVCLGSEILTASPLHCSHLNFLILIPLQVLVAGWLLAKPWFLQPLVHTLGLLQNPTKTDPTLTPHPLPPRCWSALVSELSDHQYSCSLTNTVTNVFDCRFHQLLSFLISEAGHWR